MWRHVYPWTAVSVSWHSKHTYKRIGEVQSEPHHHLMENYIVLAITELKNCWIDVKQQSSAHSLIYGERKTSVKINRFSHESLLKIWDFFHKCEKFRLFTSGRNPRSSISCLYDLSCIENASKRKKSISFEWMSHCLTRPQAETMIYSTGGDHGNHYTTDAVVLSW